MRPTRIRCFRVDRASAAEASWLARTLNRECARYGAAVDLQPDNTLVLAW